MRANKFLNLGDLRGEKKGMIVFAGLLVAEVSLKFGYYLVSPYICLSPK